jgi:AcrR family transcriptional regulator
MYYVRGKEDLLALIQERCFTRVLEGARQVVAKATDPHERLQAFIRHHVTFFAHHMAEMKVLSHEASPAASARLSGATSICSRPFSKRPRPSRAPSIAARPPTSLRHDELDLQLVRPGRHASTPIGWPILWRASSSAASSRLIRG